MTALSTLASIKISRDLVDEARTDASVFKRSLGAQVEYWARLGQAMENGPGFTLARARAAIDGRFDPADLSPEERVYYYDLLDDAMATPGPTELEDRQKLVNAGGAIGYDDAGQLVQSEPGGAVRVLNTK